MIKRIQFTQYNVTQQLSQLFNHCQLYHKSILNAFSIALVCAFCSCLLSCSAIRQLEKDNMIQTINQIIELAKHEMNQNNWISANYHLKNGLDILDLRYMHREYFDDARLTMAYLFEIDGQLEQADRKYIDILQNRLNVFKSNPLSPRIKTILMQK
jgi:Tfp pilus assembly protein PilF